MHKRPVPDIDWSPDNLLLASVAEDGGVCLWEVDSGQLVSPKATVAFHLSACLPCLHLEAGRLMLPYYMPTSSMAHHVWCSGTSMHVVVVYIWHAHI